MPCCGDVGHPLNRSRFRATPRFGTAPPAPQATDNRGRSPLYKAKEYGHSACVDLLLKVRPSHRVCFYDYECI